MKLQFLGATKTVTGSKYLLTTDKKILIDCGLYQGFKSLRLRNRDPFPVDPASIDAVIITHAHLDHTGYLPLLVKHGFKGEIYCTDVTQEICRILLFDAAHIQEEEAYRANKHGYSKHKPALPLFTRADAAAVLPLFKVVSFHEEFTIGETTAYLNQAGHILGAGTVIIKHKDNSILFSGDLGRAGDPFVFHPEKIVSTKYLVVESTYGDRLHEHINPKEQLGEIIRNTAKRGGTVIIPAFAVGRAQTILYYLQLLQQEDQIPNLPVFLDSPMAEEVISVMLKYSKEYNLPKAYVAAAEIADYVESVSSSKKIDTYKFPRIIISASGMLVGGRVLHHISALAGDERNVIVLAGYQAPGTRGDYLLSGHKNLRIYGHDVEVRAEIITLSNTSAHADYQELLAWLKQIEQPPQKVFLTHGNEKSIESLKDKITTQLNWQCVVPEYLQVEEL